MQKLADGLILYHGSYCEVRQPQLEKCAKRKDFGQGFYLTTSKEQAISFLNTAIAKAEAGGLASLCYSTQKKEFFYGNRKRNGAV